MANFTPFGEMVFRGESKYYNNVQGFLTTPVVFLPVTFFHGIIVVSLPCTVDTVGSNKQNNQPGVFLR